MIAFLESIGFTDTEQAEYLKYKKIAAPEVAFYAKTFMEGNMPYGEAMEKSRKTLLPLMHEYTADLLFLIECAALLREKYIKSGISLEIYTETMKDIKYKLDECKKVKNVFGNFVAWWYREFFDMERFALGRLQYDIREYGGEDICVKGFEIKNGDFILACHIPSSGPLSRKGCIDSYKKAYEFFKCRIRNNILPVICSTWLFYPPYESVFGENSNTVKFACDFEIVKIEETEKFNDSWRLFGMKYEDNADTLPTETSLQKKFVSYIKEGKTFGLATGFLLFDGERVITERN